MLFKNRKDMIFKEGPLLYWEEKSYMVAICAKDDINPLAGALERIEKINDIEVLEKRELNAEKPAYVKLKYKGEEYEINFFPDIFTLQSEYLLTHYRFTSEETESLKKVHKAMIIYMSFSHHKKESYHLQLKVAKALVPDMLALFDESAEKLLPKGWVKMAVESSIEPASGDLYNIQVVSGKKGEVWLHTHGLCRYGLTELEILESDQKNYHEHYNLLYTYANFLLDKDENFDPSINSSHIGFLMDKTPIVVTAVPWTKALKEFPKLSLGGIQDRQNGHNSKTSVIFIYQNEEDAKNNILSKVAIYNGKWEENPIYFISNEETERMKKMAIERFSYAKEAFKNKDNEVLIKIGLETNLDDDGLEHIWFKLIEVDKDKFKAKLTQEPYNVPDIHTGDEKWFTKEDITDWIIYTKEDVISPDNSYILLNNN